MTERDAALDAAIRAACVFWNGPCRWPACDCRATPAAVRAAIAAWQAAQPALLPAPPPFNAQRVADINARGIIDEVCGEWAIETPQGFATALWDRLAASLSVAPSPSLPAEPSPGFVRVRVKVALWDQKSWTAEGSSGWDRPAEEYRIALDRKYGAHTYFIVADVPLPQPPAEVTGRVET